MINGHLSLNTKDIEKFEEFTPESITIKIYPVTAQVDAETTGTGVDQLFNQQAVVDATEPILVDNTITRKKFGLIFLQATTLPATAGAIPAASTPAMRVQVINARMTVNKLDYADKITSAEVTFKWMPFQKDGSSNKRVESTDDSAQLPAAITAATTF